MTALEDITNKLLVPASAHCFADPGKEFKDFCKPFVPDCTRTNNWTAFHSYRAQAVQFLNYNSYWGNYNFELHELVTKCKCRMQPNGNVTISLAIDPVRSWTHAHWLEVQCSMHDAYNWVQLLVVCCDKSFPPARYLSTRYTKQYNCNTH